MLIAVLVLVSIPGRRAHHWSEGVNACIAVAALDASQSLVVTQPLRSRVYNRREGKAAS